MAQREIGRSSFSTLPAIPERQESSSSINLPWSTVPRGSFLDYTGLETPRVPVESFPIPGSYPKDVEIEDTKLNASQLDPEREDPRGNVWELYNQRSEYEDADRLQELNSNMDVLLVFAGLFSGVVTAFVIETYRTLKPDQVDLTNQLLLAILQNQPANATEISQVTDPPAYAIRANALLFSSLITSLSAALAAMTVKQSVGYYSKGLRGITSKQIRARTRQMRHSGLIKWHLPDVVALIPLTLHLSLFFFFAGVIDFLFAINRIVASVSLSLAAAGAALYVVANILPLLSSAAPFRSPFTQLVEGIARRVHKRYSSSRKRSNRDEGPNLGGEHVEHPEELWFGGDERQARFVRLTRTLDVEAIIWLMSVVDKTTERHILELCFEKLMAFRDIALKDPSCFLHREIARTFRQLASTCMEGKQTRTIYPPRLRRARMLCQFLYWYLNLARNPQDRRWLRDHLPYSVISLTEAFGRSARESDNLEDVITARVASRRLSHLHTPRGRLCDKCMRDTDIHQALWPSSSDTRLSVASEYLMQDIISLTECVTARVSDFRDTSEGTLEQGEIERTLERTTRLLREYGEVVDFKSLADYLRSQRPRTFISVDWCSQLLRSLEQPARTSMASLPPSIRAQSPGGHSQPGLRPRGPRPVATTTIMTEANLQEATSPHIPADEVGSSTLPRSRLLPRMLSPIPQASVVELEEYPLPSSTHSSADLPIRPLPVRPWPKPPHQTQEM